MKKVAYIREIEPEESMCITVDSDRKLFKAGGNKLGSNSSISTIAKKAGAMITNDTWETKSIHENTYSVNNEIIEGNGLDTGAAFVSHNSVLQRNIVFSCILRPESWSFVGVDLKKVELTPYIRYKNVVLGVATTIENAVEVLRFAQQTMMKRYEMMTLLEVKNFIDLPEKGRALLVMVDEYAEVASPMGLKTEEGKEDDAMKGEIQMIVGSIARLGRAAGVHVAVATQRPDAKLLPGETKYLSIDTPVLTTQGFKLMGDIELGDKVFDEQGKTTTVVNLTEHMSENPVYTMRFAGNEESIIAGAPHKWPVYKIAKDVADVTGTVAGNVDNCLLMSTEEIYHALEKDQKHRYVLDVTKPIEMEEKSFPIAPFVLGSWLRGEDVHNNKHIPHDYLFSSIKQRQQLLAGLLNKTDITDNRYTFTHESRQLSNDVGLLSRTLGYKAVVHGKDSLWHVEIEHGHKGVHVIEKIEKANTVLTKCIEVDNDSHTYLAGESLVPTHNSNLGCRINCGYTDSMASSMILDSSHGTKVKSDPVGRFYLQIYSKGNHGQGFFAPEDWMDKYLDSQGLNADGTPKGGSGSAENNMDESMPDLELKSAKSSVSARPEDDWDDELDSLIEENES